MPVEVLAEIEALGYVVQVLDRRWPDGRREPTLRVPAPLWRVYQLGVAANISTMVEPLRD